MQKAFSFFQTVASSKRQQGELFNHLFFGLNKVYLHS